jgi:replication-associated recombination protein RarA
MTPKGRKDDAGSRWRLSKRTNKVYSRAQEVSRRITKMSDEELEQIRKRKLMSMQSRVSDEQRQAQAEAQIEQQKQALLAKILAPEARQRLNNLKMVKKTLRSKSSCSSLRWRR